MCSVLSAMSKDGMGLQEIGGNTATGTVEITERFRRLGEVGEQPMAMEIGGVSAQTNATFPDSEDEEELQLLPGLPNELIWYHIIPTLPWRAVRMLSSVSRGWQQAIRSRQICDARVRSGSTETLIVFNYNFDAVHAITLYSITDNHFYKLPRFPLSEGRLPRRCQCVSINGVIYVLGDCSEVYALDVAGQGEWKQCAKMQEPRQDFGCGIKDGKIYVFGGCAFNSKKISGCEVYDPQLDAWSSIAPMRMKRCDLHVATLGEEMLVYGGQVDSPGYYFGDSYVASAVSFSEVYHPGKDEWRSVEPLGYRLDERLFTAQGKLHSMTPYGISVHGSDGAENSWSQRHSFLFEYLGQKIKLSIVSLHALHVVNGELLALVDVGNSEVLGLVDIGFDGTGSQFIERFLFLCKRLGLKMMERVFLQSKGFGSENEEIVWKKVDFSLTFDFDQCAPFICPIQL